MPEEDPVSRDERWAAEFYKETGHMAPIKDRAAAACLPTIERSDLMRMWAFFCRWKFALEKIEDLRQRNAEMEEVLIRQHDDALSGSLTIGVDWADGDDESVEMAWCAKCGAQHQIVRPGKTQPTCDCWDNDDAG